MVHSRNRQAGIDFARGAFIAALMAALGAALLAPDAAPAQSSYPNKPIHFVVGFAAGGPSDIISRVIGAKMAEERPAGRGGEPDRRWRDRGDRLCGARGA